MKIRNTDSLQRALRAAVAGHRVDLVRWLLDEHGARLFAQALVPCSSRVMADALSLLPEPARAEVGRHLPQEARQRLTQAGLPLPGATLCRQLARLVPQMHRAAFRRIG